MASSPRSAWPASSPDAATTSCGPWIPTTSTPSPAPDTPTALSASVVGHVHPEHQGLRGQLLPPGRPPASVLDGLITLTRPRPHPYQQGSPHPRLLSPTRTPSSSTQETQDAPTPPTTAHHPACTGPRAGQGRSSSLRSGRSTLTSHSGPELDANKALTGAPRTRNAGSELSSCGQVRMVA